MYSDLKLHNINATGTGAFIGLTSTGGLTITGAVSLPNDSITDAMVSNTLTASDLVAGSSVVSNAEVDDDITLTNITQITNRAFSNITGGTAGSIIFSNGTNLAEDNSNLFWDDSANRFGLSTTTPGSILSIQGVGNFQAATSTLYAGLTAPGFLATSSGVTISGGALNLNSESFTDLTGTGLQNTGGALTLNATGDWTGTLDGIEGASFLRSDASDSYTSGTLTFDSGTNLIINGNLGIATSTPGTAFAIQGVANFTGGTSTMYSNVNMGNLTATNTLSTLGSFKIGTENYTSFLGNGLDNTAGVLTANCVEITGSAGLCDGDDAAGGGGAFSWTPGFYGATAVNSTTTAIQFQSGLYASSTVRFGNAGVSPFFYDGAVGNLGLGTTSPFARLSVAGNTVLDSNLITFASSSASTLTLDYRAAATSTIPNNQFYAWTIGTSTTATPIFRINTALNGSNATIATTSIKGGFTLDDGAFNYDSFAGVASVDSLSTGPMAFDEDSGILSWIDMPSSTTTARLYNSYSAQIDSTSILTIFATTTTSGNITKGNVGIGTTTPPWTLTVVGGVCITTGSTCPAAEVNGGLRVDTAGTVADDPGDVFDIAERYPASEPLGAGEIVALDSATTSRALVKKAAWGETVIGVVSTRPALAINGSEVILGAQQEGTSTRPLVALSGRVPVKVNLEGGAIHKGDRITLSSVAGVGTKATSSGVTIGIALEEFSAPGKTLGVLGSSTPSVEEDVGKVLVFINLGWSNLDGNLFSFMDASSSPMVEMGSGRIKANYVLDMDDQDIINVRSILSSSGTWSIDENGKLTVDEIHAKKLCLEDICVTKEELKNLLDNAGQAPALTTPGVEDPVIPGVEENASSTPPAETTPAPESTPGVEEPQTPDVSEPLPSEASAEEESPPDNPPPEPADQSASP